MTLVANGLHGPGRRRPLEHRITPPTVTTVTHIQTGGLKRWRRTLPLECGLPESREATMPFGPAIAAFTGELAGRSKVERVVLHHGSMRSIGGPRR